VEHELNNEIFTNGYGLACHAYIISRRYIESIINKYGSLPNPNGRHIDYEQHLNIIDKDNRLYTEKLFFFNHEAFKQQIGKSDNGKNTKTILSMLEDFLKLFNNKNSDRTFEISIFITIGRFLKKYKLITDKNAKLLTCYLSKHLSVNA
jgi:hypothetical protein